ncbi:MAG: hypothetical protein ACOCZD_00220 [Haloferacaceae archaeon]
MEVTDTREPATEAEPPIDSPRVAALRTSPGRTVLTEEGNCDGWIATDFLVSLPR